MTQDDHRRCEVLLAVQNALLGQITPNVRAVTVAYEATSVRIEAFFDGAVSDDDRESMALVETEVLATFPESHTVVCAAIRIDAPAAIPKNRTWVYYRKED